MGMYNGRIRNKLVIPFVLFVTVVIGGSGWFLYRSTKRSLEDQLGDKLIVIAQMAATQISGDLVTRLKPGDEESRTYANLIRKLERIKEATGAKRLYVFDPRNRSLLDTGEDVSIGREYVKLRFDGSELEAVWRGRASHSILFRGSDGAFYKSGFAPIKVKDRVVAAVGVDVSATFLTTIEGFRRSVLAFGMVSVLITVIIGFLLAKTITDPIQSLVRSAMEIGRGNLNRKVSVRSNDELGYLGHAMDRMRRGIIDRDHQLKTMLAGIAHEIRNPLGGIELFAGLAADELEDESKGKEHIRKIIKEVNTLNRIIGEFLDFARPSEPRKESVSLEALIDEVALLSSPDFEGKGIVFRKDFSQDQIRVYADPEQIRRAFLNLFKNAIQAMEQGGVLIVRGELREDMVKTEIRDTGRGIPKEDSGRLFDPFFTTREKGAGLGLSIVKKIVEAHSGKISVVSEPGQGATFTAWLPASSPSDLPG